jgi:phosphoenolpyruvate-protein phosphotransferase (PTS system enzyme I)
MLKGIPASSGIAIGKALILNRTELEVLQGEIQNTEQEIQRFINALEIAKNQLEEIKGEAEKNIGRENAAIFDAHIMMLEDEELISMVSNKILGEKSNAEYALKTTIEGFIQVFEEMDNEYMRERASDIKDVGNRILNIMMSADVDNVNLKNITGDYIIVAKDLTPSDTANMNRNSVLGFVTQIGGRTSHTAIMARTLEIPALVGVGTSLLFIKNDDLLILDGDEGVIIINPSNSVINNYEAKRRLQMEDKNELKKLKYETSTSIDGRSVELAGNIGSAFDVEGVISSGGEGVGLFRTEFLYMNKDSLPDEEEQYLAYKEVLEKMKGKPVVIRTLDIGGDKKLTYLPIPEEMNPFLGYRAIRICLDKQDIFKTQLRALLRASIYGNLKIMFPMISCLEELRDAKSVVREVKNALDKENILYSKEIQVGIMIEIPSAAIMSDILAKEVDFFSIGTNDLIQYTVAVDRMNEKISGLYNPYNISVLRLIKLVIENAHNNNIWVGMCGEVAGDLSLIPLLFGLGLDEFSMAASSILKARKLIRNINYEKCKELADEALNLSSSDEIKNYVKLFGL